MDEKVVYDWIGKDGKKAITSSHLYSLYTKWANENNEIVLSLRTFHKNIKDEIGSKRQNSLKNKRNRYYQF